MGFFKSDEEKKVEREKEITNELETGESYAYLSMGKIKIDRLAPQDLDFIKNLGWELVCASETSNGVPKYYFKKIIKINDTFR